MSWASLDREIVECTRCPRLIEHCRETARVKRRMYQDEPYWGRPVTGFGDRSGEWLYAALHRAGLASRPSSATRDDGLRLKNAYISNVCRCAPPGNRPARDEIENCRPFLDREFDGLRRLRVVVPLGSIAWEAVLRRSRSLAPDAFPRPKPAFGHGAEARLTLRTGRPPLLVVGCYHPSQQNTQTGRLTRSMLDRVMRRASRSVENE